MCPTQSFETLKVKETEKIMFRR